MKYLQADILSKPTHDKTLILHGCNCFHTMGSGIAKYLRAKYPKVYAADVNQTVDRDVGKLGSFSIATINQNFHVLNCYTQYKYGCVRGMDADYRAIEKCLKNLRKQYGTEWKIRAPKIGCGLAGGDWEVVRPIFEEQLKEYDVTIYSLN